VAGEIGASPASRSQSGEPQDREPDHGNDENDHGEDEHDGAHLFSCLVVVSAV
jgi:hypothetical protein